MSISIDMMPRPDAALTQRLETLTGEDGACCADDYAALGAKIRASARFTTAIARAKAMSDERRLLALALLKRRTMCACEIQAALGLTHATVSHHMALLVDAGLVAVERRGKWAYYTLTTEGRDHAP